MSKRASPTAIGLFMIGAIILVVVGIATLATTTWFDNRATFVSAFEESVNGLEVGAPVKFKGVPVGEVRELRIRIDLDDKTFAVPVVYDINLSRLTTGQGTYVNLEDASTLRRQVLDGLRAQLQMESFVTGQLYIELTYVSNPEPELAALEATYDEYLRIPTTPSLLSAFGDEAGSLVAGLQSFDVSSISRNLVELLMQANEKLDQLDVNQLNTSLAAAAQSFQDLAEAPEIRTALRDVPALTEQFNQTLLEVQGLSQRLGGAVDPLQLQLETANQEIVLTLQGLRGAVEEMQTALSSDTGLAYRLEETLMNLSEAAEALERLARSLEENPSSLIRGKNQPE